MLIKVLFFFLGSCIEFEDVEGDDDDMAVDYPCPFCSDDYDLVELCHHIDDEHQLDANNGVISIHIHLQNFIDCCSSII